MPRIGTAGFATTAKQDTINTSVGALVQQETIKTAVINIATAATHTIVAAVSGKKISIVALVFTVAGEVNVTLQSNATAISGAMDFGGTDEPRGIAQVNGNYPLQTNTGEAFKMTLSAAIQVSGYVTYYED